MKGKITDIEKIWLSNKEASKYLGCSLDFLARLRETAQLSFYQFGNEGKGRKMIWYSKNDLDKFVRKHMIV